MRAFGMSWSSLVGTSYHFNSLQPDHFSSIWRNPCCIGFLGYCSCTLGCAPRRSMQNQAPGHFHFKIERGLYWKIVPFLHLESTCDLNSSSPLCENQPDSVIALQNFTGWVRIQLPDVIKTRPISILMGAKMQLLEVVTGHSQFLSHFSILVPQAIPTQPVTGTARRHNSAVLSQYQVDSHIAATMS